MNPFHRENDITTKEFTDIKTHMSHMIIKEKFTIAPHTDIVNHKEEVL